jgi:hypothetical protein
MNMTPKYFIVNGAHIAALILTVGREDGGDDGGGDSDADADNADDAADDVVGVSAWLKGSPKKVLFANGFSGSVKAVVLCHAVAVLFAKSCMPVTISYCDTSSPKRNYFTTVLEWCCLGAAVVLERC